MKERKRDFLCREVVGLSIGRRDRGGVPNVMQWIRLKPGHFFLSECHQTFSENGWWWYIYSLLVSPVLSLLHLPACARRVELQLPHQRSGLWWSKNSCFLKDHPLVESVGEHKPVQPFCAPPIESQNGINFPHHPANWDMWVWYSLAPNPPPHTPSIALPVAKLTKKPSGLTGAEFKLIAQSIKVWVPLIANITRFRSSIGTDWITIALVPSRQLASTCVSLSLRVGLEYARWEYCAARHRRGYEGG